MKEFIESLLFEDLIIKDVERKFCDFGYSDDYDVYSTFTENDLKLRDEFESYLASSSDIAELRQKWQNR